MIDKKLKAQWSILLFKGLYNVINEKGQRESTGSVIPQKLFYHNGQYLYTCWREVNYSEQYESIIPKKLLYCLKVWLKIGCTSLFYMLVQWLSKSKQQFSNVCMQSNMYHVWQLPLFFSQQKLVLRNNSTSATQQLRLLIRGQDQDCFQVDLKMTSVSSRPLSSLPVVCWHSGCFFFLYYLLFSYAKWI